MFGRLRFAVSNGFGSIPETILVNSLPKSGTHLLTSILLQIPGIAITGNLTNADKSTNENPLQAFKNGISQLRAGIWPSHIPYNLEIDQEIENIKLPTIFIYRDPRSVLVSLAHYVYGNKNHIYTNMIDGLSLSQIMDILIDGFGEGKEKYELSEKSIPSISNYVNAYANWLTSKAALSISYESIVGSTQKETLNLICDHLKLKHTVSKYLRNGVGNKNSYTYRSAEINAWQKELTAEQIKKIETQKWADNSKRFFYHETN